MNEKVKYLGVERAIDDLGRITLPISFRKALGINPSQAMSMQLVELNGEKVIVVKKATE